MVGIKVACESYVECPAYYPYSDWCGVCCTSCCWFWNGFWKLFPKYVFVDLMRHVIRCRCITKCFWGKIVFAEMQFVLGPIGREAKQWFLMNNRQCRARTKEKKNTQLVNMHKQNNNRTKHFCSYSMLILNLGWSKMYYNHSHMYSMSEIT